MSGNAPSTPGRPGGPPRDVLAGLFLLLLAGIALAATAHLAVWEGGSVGPGLMPFGVALLLAAIGLIVTVLGVIGPREGFGALAPRGPLFVLGAVALFAGTIRTLGLAVAAPLAVILAALADRETRPVEIVVYAAVISTLCVLLFRLVLRLPIPLAPTLLGY